MLSQLRAAFVPLSQTTTAPATAPATDILPISQPPQQPHPTSTYHRFARHTRPAAADHPSPAQQPILPSTSTPNHSDDTAATHQQSSTISSPTTVTTNGSGNSWTSVNKDSYSQLNSSAMAGGAAGWSDAEKIQLLVEILKDCEAAPNWRNIKIPPGRSPLQAQHVFASLTSSPPPSPRPQQSSAPAAFLPPPLAAAKKRGPPPGAQTPGTPGEPPIKRKRGRPSKADIALRQQQLQGAGDAGATWQAQMYTPDTSRGGVSLTAPGTAPAGVLGETPVKKKRGRPSKAELERRELERQALLEQHQKAAAAAAASAQPQQGGASATGHTDADAEAEDDDKKEEQSPSRASEDAAGDSPEE